MKTKDFVKFEKEGTDDIRYSTMIACIVLAILLISVSVMCGTIRDMNKKNAQLKLELQSVSNQLVIEKDKNDFLEQENAELESEKNTYIKLIQSFDIIEKE